MTFLYFIASLIILCAACIASFISAFSERRFLLVIFVPIITLCGSIIYFSYASVLGYPTKLTWEQLPNQFTVIYFKIHNKEKIDLWLFENSTTRLITLPFSKPAEEAMESERQTMGQGTPVTFKKSKENKKGQPGQNGEIRDSTGNDEENETETSQQNWDYKVESKGDPIPGNALPPKVQ